MNARSLLGKEVLAALKRYKDNRKNHDTVPWDKEKDLKHIMKCARKRPHYAGFEACAGTFWFYYYKKNWKMVRVHVHKINAIKLLVKNASHFD